MNWEELPERVQNCSTIYMAFRLSEPLLDMVDREKIGLVQGGGHLFLIRGGTAMGIGCHKGHQCCHIPNSRVPC